MLKPTRRSSRSAACCFVLTLTFLTWAFYRTLFVSSSGSVRFPLPLSGMGSGSGGNKKNVSLSGVDHLVTQLCHLAEGDEEGGGCTSGRWLPRRPAFDSIEDYRKAQIAEFAAASSKQHEAGAVEDEEGIALDDDDDDDEDSERNAYIEGLGPGALWTGCPMPESDLLSGYTEKQRRLGEEKRLLDVMNWVWMPWRGVVLSWDAEKFVVRLLRSPGGLFLIGDTVTKQHSDVLIHMLRQAGITLDLNPPHLPQPSSQSPSLRRNVFQYVLRPSSATTLRLVRLAGVPRTRALRPVVTLVKDYMLAGEADVREIVERLGAPSGFRYVGALPSAEGWEDLVMEAAKPREGEPRGAGEWAWMGEEDGVEEGAARGGEQAGGAEGRDTVVVLNTGHNWSRYQLSMLPSRKTGKEEQTRVREAFKQMVKLITGRLSSIPRLSVYYRSTSPGHPTCIQHAVPYPDYDVALEAEGLLGSSSSSSGNKGKGMGAVDLSEVLSPAEEERWRRQDWDLFGTHNEVWNRTVGRLMRGRRLALEEARVVGALPPGGGGGRKKGKGKGQGQGKAKMGAALREGWMRRVGARWAYWDVWEMAVQRPDAHLQPGVDCLQWCLPSLMEEWTRQLYHFLTVEEELE